jgi:uncharacterized membrane protein
MFHYKFSYIIEDSTGKKKAITQKQIEVLKLIKEGYRQPSSIHKIVGGSKSACSEMLMRLEKLGIINVVEYKLPRFTFHKIIEITDFGYELLRELVI